MPEFRPFRPFLPSQDAIARLFGHSQPLVGTAGRSLDATAEQSEKIIAEQSRGGPTGFSEDLAAGRSLDATAEQSEKLIAEQSRGGPIGLSEDLAAGRSQDATAEQSEKVIAEQSRGGPTGFSEDLAAGRSLDATAEQSEKLIAEQSRGGPTGLSEDLAAGRSLDATPERLQKVIQEPTNSGVSLRAQGWEPGQSHGGAVVEAPEGVAGLLEALVPGLPPAERKSATLATLNRWNSWMAEGVYRRASPASFLLYEVRYRDRWQHGWIGLTDARDVGGQRNLIRKHEHVRADRVAHLDSFTRATGLQTTPVFLSHPQHSGLSQLMYAVQSQVPDRMGKLPDGREFRLWQVSETHYIEKITRWVAEMPCLYIADGHHRAAVAAQQAENEPQSGGHSMLSILVPANELHVFPFYRRILNDEGPFSLWDLLDRLRAQFYVRPCLIEQMYYQYLPNGQYLLCTHQACWQLARKEPTEYGGETGHPARTEDQLDVGRLHSEIIAPLLGITDPTRDPRIEYGPLSMPISDFKRMLQDSGTAFVLIARAPTAEDIFRVADSGGVMPPKSTSVEPKIIDGLVVWVDGQ